MQFPDSGCLSQEFSRTLTDDSYLNAGNKLPLSLGPSWDEDGVKFLASLMATPEVTLPLLSTCIVDSDILHLPRYTSFSKHPLTRASPHPREAGLSGMPASGERTVAWIPAAL